MARRKKDEVVESVVVKEDISAQDFSHIISREFMRYAYYVMEDRALPDARDGLKPSQRRVLVAMDDLNLKPSGRTCKCAKICGDTSGNYHPHGEQVVYPTLTRMAQDWAIRYPLIFPQGNFGSLDKDSSPAAMRYCIVGDSLAITGLGLVPMTEFSKEISSDDNINIQVLSASGKINNADKFFDCGLHPVAELKTQHGYTISGTLNHPLLTLSADVDGKMTLGWKLIGDIDAGDWLVLDRSQVLFPIEKIKLSSFHPVIESKHRKECNLPDVLDEDLALIMGSVIAEGNTSSDRVQFTNNHGQYAYKVLSAWEKIFGAHTIHVFFREPQGNSVNEYASLECHFLHIQNFMHNIGLTPESSRDKHIPFSILQSPKTVVASFLRGLFEGDGGVENCQRNRRISLTSYSETLIKETQIVLLRFGIMSKIYPDKTRGGFRLCITGITNLKSFRDQIGFISDIKIEALETILQGGYKDGVSHSDYIPFLSAYVRKHGKGEWINKNNFDRLSRINDAMPELQKALPDEIYLDVKALVDTGYGYTQVIEKLNQGEKNVYSFRVDSDCHSFVANGFINHNTEAKLSKYGESLLADLSSNVVDYIPNYNEERQEPTVLPSLLPNLLVNGTSGIAVGVATKLPPHNLREIVNVIEAYIKNNDLTVDEILSLMPGPDFPTGGVLLGQDGVKSYYETGRGSLQLEGVYSIEDAGKGTQKIVITELPYGSSPEELLQQIASLVKEKKIDGVTDMKDLSHKKKGEMRTIHVSIWLSKNANTNLVLNKILKHTCLRISYNVNQTVLIDGAVVENAPIKTLVKAFVDHRAEILSRKFAAELKKSQARIHVLGGLINVSKQIDAVIAVIRSSEDVEDAQNKLIAKGFVESPEQAKAVLAITLAKLTKLEAQGLIDERSRINDRIEWLESVLGDTKKILKLIIKEQQDLAKSIGDDRRTKLGKMANDINQEDLVQEEQIIISLTKDGYIKRMPIDTYRVQSRGGKGVTGTGKKEDDEMSDMFVASTHDIILFFTNRGLVYRKKGYEIPNASRTAKGTHLANILSLQGGEAVTNMIPVNNLNEKGHLVFITNKGMIKRSTMSDYDTSLKARGLPAIKLREDDSLAFVEATNGKQDIFIVTKNGKAIRYPETTVRVTGRMTAGVKAFNMAHDDTIAQMLVFSPNDNSDIIVITEMGFGKRTESSKYRCFTGRFAKGVNTIDKVRFDRNGHIVGACIVNSEDTIIMMTSQGKVIQIPVESVRSVNRVAMGVKMLNLDAGDIVTSVTKIVNGAVKELEKTDES